MKTLFKNAKILDLDIPSGYKMGCVAVEGGIISYVGEAEPGGNFDKIIDASGKVLMPGFVNAHTHTAMSLLRGVKDDALLDEWLYEGVVPLEEKMTASDVYWGELLGIAESVRNGITTIEENYFLYEGICKALSKSGIRARVGIGARVKETKNAKNTYKECGKIYKIIKKETDSNLVNMVVYSHSIYEVDEKEFEGILDFANDYNLPLSIHLSETLKEVGDCTAKNNGQTPPQYLESLGYLDRECLCYHCVHMDKDDLQILADYNASVATCPSSNIKLASGIAPIYAMQNKGINIAIGTDGPASNNSLDMFKEMFLVATLSKVSLYDSSVVTAREVLEMATINGAKALGVNSGEIKVGKNADLILVDTHAPHMQPENNLLSNLVYSACGSDVYLTMINGEIKYHDGEYFIGEDIEKIYKQANQISQRLMNDK